MFRWSINLFRVFGIQIALHVSFLILLVYSGYSGYEEGGAAGLLWGVALLMAYFLCIVLHELGHSLTARRFGIQVRRILLMPIGGMAEFESIPRIPRQELLITIAGPAVNFGIAGVLWLTLRTASHAAGNPAAPDSLGDFGETLFVWNIGIGLFNLIPAFPMDGGRILRALLATRLPYVRATFVAATTGKVIAGIGMVAAAGLALYTQIASLWFLTALFMFIFTVGEMEYRALLVRERRDAEWEAIAARLARVQSGDYPAEPPVLERWHGPG